MEPVTHLLTGACLARTGFNRKAAYATVAMTLAAEAPDLDTLWSLRGPIAGFEHHRGWTHTLLGIPFEAALLLAAVYLIHRWRQRRETRRHPSQPQTPQSTPNPPRTRPTAAPLNWPFLYLGLLTALASHLLLDWTNNYGLRPFFPFNPRWYAGSFVFIFEPLLFAFLLLGLLAPALFGLISGEIGARRPPFRGRGWAITALLLTVALWTLRYTQHSKALDLARNADTSNVPPAPDSADAPISAATVPAHTAAPITRVFASPHPINPFRWSTIAETPTFYQLATADTLNNTLETNGSRDLIYKPPTTLYTLIAKRTWLGEAYLDWSSFPLVTDTGLLSGAVPTGNLEDGLTAVTFRDLRFMYNTTLLSGRQSPPLSGTVLINPDHHVVQQTFDNRIQH